MLNDEYQSLVMNTVAHWAERAGMAAIEREGIVRDEQCRPSVLYRPRLSLDGNSWCALYGENLQEGCAGFGDSPAEAMTAFDKAWVAAQKGGV